MTNILTIFDYLPILIWAERGSLSNGVSFRGRTRPKLCLSRLKSRETKAPGALRVDCADSRFLDDGNVLVSWSLRFFWNKNYKIKRNRWFFYTILINLYLISFKIHVGQCKQIRRSGFSFWITKRIGIINFHFMVILEQWRSIGQIQDCSAIHVVIINKVSESQSCRWYRCGTSGKCLASSEVVSYRFWKIGG